MDEHRPDRVRPHAPDSGSDRSEASEPSGEPGPPPTPRVGMRDLFDILLTPATLALLAVAGGLWLIGLLGGWNAVEAKEVELSRVTADQTVRAEPFELNFRKAYWYTDIRGLPYHERGHRALMVTVDVTNTSKQPVGLVEVLEVFRIGVGGLKGYQKTLTPEQIQPEVYRGSDLLLMKTLQPGLITRLVLIWSQRNTEPVPQKLEVTAYRQTYRASYSSGGKAYFDPEPLAVATLPMAEFKLP